MNIFVGNLAFTTTEEELAELFHPYGEIASIRITRSLCHSWPATSGSTALAWPRWPRRRAA